MRGLKLRFSSKKKRSKVAPLTGAWIETNTLLSPAVPSVVAPLTGAWIETSLRTASVYGMLSHPSRVRGLKLIIKVKNIPNDQVAPLTGAWIPDF